MNIGSTYCRFVAAAALALGLSHSALHAQSVHQPLPEPLVIHRKGDAARFPNVLSSVPTQEYSHGDPTAEEQYIVELINRARANPTAEGIMLATVTDPAILAAYTYWNVNKEKLKTDFAGYPVQPPLAISPKLTSAARLHSKDMSDNNFQGHEGSNGSQLQDRLNNAGYTGWTAGGENVSAYSRNLLYGHVGFNVDWGVPSLGHRMNIMNFEGDFFTEVGIGIVHDARPAPHVGPIIITECFGNANGPFLVGVVYNDANKNKFYDVGEGIPGVRITPSTGTYYATTSTSGGYAIPITATGAMTVTAAGGSLTSPITLNVTLDDEDNVKLDFTPGLPSLPGVVTLQFPSNNARVPSDSVRLRWRPIPGATHYRLQVSTNANFSTMIVNDSTRTDTSFVLRELTDLSSYYWRVQAENSGGWGPVSEPQKFTVLFLPVKALLVSPANGATIPTSNTRFSWNRGSSQAQMSYWFEIATDAAMTNIFLRDTTLADTSLVVNGLQTGQTYYWRIRAGNAAGWGAFSDNRTVVTATSGVEESASAGSIRLSENVPNPFSGVTHIRFELPTAQDVTLTILNNLGQRVTTLLSGRLAADSYDIPWDAGTMENGIYYYQLRAGNFVATRKMVLAR
jgi:uncharacterized protein YkwD